jgi:hypothetical protein
VSGIAGMRSYRKSREGGTAGLLCHRPALPTPPAVSQRAPAARLASCRCVGGRHGQPSATCQGRRSRSLRQVGRRPPSRRT